jgi:DNA repair exonuclease SbcCD nuclease subunit
MKLVICSDAHVDARTSGVDRLVDVANAMGHVAKVAIQEGADLFVFLGDLMDPDHGPRVLRGSVVALTTARHLQQNGVSSVWIAGNHDVVEDGSGTTSLTPLHALTWKGVPPRYPEVALFEEPGVLDYAMTRILALPFPATSRQYDVAAFIREHAECGDRRLIILSHLQVDGAQRGEESSEMARGRDVWLPLDVCSEVGAMVLQGHYHRAQAFQHGRSAIIIVGALQRLTHGEEEHEPRFLVLEV